MTPFTIKSSSPKYLLLLIVAVGFVAVGVLMVTRGTASEAWIGWMNIVFFGSGVPLFAWQLIDSRPRLVIDDDGILDRTLGVGVIPWPEITGAFLMSIQGNDFICLEVRDPALWITHLSPIKRAMVSANEVLGFTTLNLNLGGVAADSSQILELVLRTLASQQQNRDSQVSPPK